MKTPSESLTKGFEFVVVISESADGFHLAVDVEPGIGSDALKQMLSHTSQGFIVHVLEIQGGVAAAA